MVYSGKSTDTASTNTGINLQGKINKRSCLIKVKTLFFFFRDRLDLTKSNGVPKKFLETYRLLEGISLSRCRKYSFYMF